MDFYKIYSNNKALATAELQIIPGAQRSKVTKQLNKISDPVPRFFESPNQINGFWSEGEYDLMEIFKLLKFESYFFKATQKKHGLITKSGFNVHSDNDEIKEYLDARFSLMELQTGNSLISIINKIIYYLVVCSNAYLIKTRDKDFEYASSYFINNKEHMPITGYFLVHPTSLKPRFKWVRFKDGTQVKNKLIIDKWIYVNKRGAVVEFDPDDIVHFTLLKEDGMTLGTPEIISVIDDIRTLRKIEEDVQLLLYRDLFPLIHYQIDDPSIIDHTGGITELDQAKNDLERMVQDGGIATDARHKIQYIGSAGKHIEVRQYLEYFQNRVFSGLGVSAADMGMGADISGNTAQSMSKQLLDAAKLIQQELTRQFNEMVLLEIILQSPFQANALKSGERPTLKFEEIDIEWKIRTENHAADQFTKGVTTIDEVRNPRGYKTLSDEMVKRTYPHMYGAFSDHAVKAQMQMKSAAERDLVKSNKSNSNITKSSRNKKKISDEEMWIENNLIHLTLLDTIENIISTPPVNIKFNLRVSVDDIYASIANSALSKFKSGLYDALTDMDSSELPDENIIEHHISDMIKNIEKLRDKFMVDAGIAYEKDYAKLANRLQTTNVTEQVSAYNSGYKTVLDYNKFNGNVKLFHFDGGEKGTVQFDKISSFVNKHPNSKTIFAIDKVNKLPDKLSDSTINIDNNIEVKLDSMLKYIEDLETLISKGQGIKADVKLSSEVQLEDKSLPLFINAMNKQVTSFLDVISELKEQNSMLATKYSSSIEKILKGMDLVSKDNVEMMRSIADAIPKEFNVTSAPIEFKVDNQQPSIDVSLNMQDIKPEHKKVNKQIKIIRDDDGNIISADITED